MTTTAVPPTAGSQNNFASKFTDGVYNCRITSAALRNMGKSNIPALVIKHYPQTITDPISREQVQVTNPGGKDAWPEDLILWLNTTTNGDDPYANIKRAKRFCNTVLGCEPAQLNPDHPDFVVVAGKEFTGTLKDGTWWSNTGRSKEEIKAKAKESADPAAIANALQAFQMADANAPLPEQSSTSVPDFTAGADSGSDLDTLF